MQRHIIVSIYLMLTCCSVALCAQPYVTATYEPVPSGFLVRFWLHNGSSDDYLHGLGVDTLDAGSLGAPPDWYVGQTYREVQWSSALPSAFVQPGQTLGGFSYISQAAPGVLDWWTGGYWGYTGSVTPTAIPEPSGLLALGSGLGGLVLLIRWRRT